MTEARSLLAEYGHSEFDLEAITSGLINETHCVRLPDGAQFVLQKVNPIFSKWVHDDIRAVTQHLRRKSIETPLLVPTTDGRWFVETADDEVWRLMTFVTGTTHQKLENTRLAEEAGRFLGRFHEALADLEHEFKGQRVGVHDTERHIATLRTALVEHAEHRLSGDVAKLAPRLFGILDATPRPTGHPKRVVHGDPKINNMLFDASDRGKALVDLDTVGPLELSMELGDAFRSWCNPAGEDGDRIEISVDLFDAAIRGYADAAQQMITPMEVAAIVSGLQLITAELATRFCADALNESYFGWNAERFEGRGEHNLHRAQAQLALAEDVMRRRSELEAAVRRAFSRSS